MMGLFLLIITPRIAPVRPRYPFKMARALLVCFVLSLGRCTSSFTASARVPSARAVHHRRGLFGDASSPLLKIRGGDGGPAIELQTATSLKSALISTIDTFYKTMPLASAFLTCGVKASLADVVAQKRAAKEAVQADGYSETDAVILGDAEESSFEKRRNLAFFLYGGLYQGMAQEVIFNEVFPLIFGQGTDPLTVASKVLCDSLFITPFLCLPVAYVVKG